MRLTRRDWMATLFVAAAALLYALWLTGTEVLGMSRVRVVAGVVLGLGFAASASGVVPSVAELLHGSKAYLAIASSIGLAALVAGVIALVTGSEAMLATLVAVTVALWMISTVRHLMAAETQDRERAPGGGAARPKIAG